MNVIENLNEEGFVGQVQPNSLIHADCLDAMKYIESKSIDMILCDLPYGTTACKWDTVIPFNKHIKEINNRGKEIILYRDEYILQEVKKGKSYKDTIDYFDNNAIDGLWDNYNRIIKENGAIVLFGSKPFTSALVMSNPKMFKVHIVWNKKKAGNFVQGNIQPMKVHEDIVIFYKKQPTYNPQKTQLDKPQKVRNGAKNRQDRKEAGGFGGTVIYSDKFEADKKLPTTIVEISKDNYGKNVFHPTQKPVALLEYLIKTYTLEGETVLDNCAGSGSTGIACINTNRNFIGIEKDETYFKIAEKRIADAIKDNETKLF